MHVRKIEAAEEIQLLLPENQPEPEWTIGGGALVAIALLAVALPYWAPRVLGSIHWSETRRDS